MVLFAVAAIVCFEVSFAIATAFIHGGTQLLTKEGDQLTTSKTERKQEEVSFPTPPTDLRNHALSVTFAALLHFFCPRQIGQALKKMFLLQPPAPSSVDPRALGRAEAIRPGNWDFLGSCQRIATFLLLADFFFYWTHRSLHRHHRLYLFHAKHHRWTTKVAPEAGLDSSLIEFLLNSSVLVVPFAFGLRLKENELIGAMGIIGTNIAVTHSSQLVRFSHVRHHLLHHKIHKFNFGATPIFDKLFGTAYDQ